MPGVDAAGTTGSEARAGCARGTSLPPGAEVSVRRAAGDQAAGRERGCPAGRSAAMPGCGEHLRRACCPHDRDGARVARDLGAGAAGVFDRDAAVQRLHEGRCGRRDVRRGCRVPGRHAARERRPGAGLLHVGRARARRLQQPVRPRGVDVADHAAMGRGRLPGEIGLRPPEGGGGQHSSAGELELDRAAWDRRREDAGSQHVLAFQPQAQRAVRGAVERLRAARLARARRRRRGTGCRCSEAPSATATSAAAAIPRRRSVTR